MFNIGMLNSRHLINKLVSENNLLKQENDLLKKKIKKLNPGKKDGETVNRPIHVILIQPSEPFGANGLIPQSLLELASVLKEASIIVEIIDARLDDLTSWQTIDLLKEKEFDLVGITGLNNAYRFIKDFCLEFKRSFPEKPLIAGGHFIMSTAEAILKRIPIDVACIGEADEIIVDLVKCLIEKRPIDGINNIAYLKDGNFFKTEFKLVENLDKLPLPAYELLDMERYIENIKNTFDTFHVTTGRGCVNHCYYCGNRYKKVRKLSPSRLIEIFDYLHSKYGLNAFYFSEENAFYPQEWLIEVCKKLNELDRRYELILGGCADHVTEELVQTLASLKGRVLNATIAVEHWNKDIQKKFFRLHQSKQIRTALDLLKKYNIPNGGFSILWGHPDDTLESFSNSFMESLEVQRIYEIENLSLRALLTIPNTQFLKDGVKQGKISDYEDYMYATSGYAPFVNLTQYDNDNYRKFILELQIKKIILSQNNWSMRIKYRLRLVLLKMALKLPLSLREFLRDILEKYIFRISMYDRKIRYFHKLACFEEILGLPKGAGIIVVNPTSRENLNKIFNSVSESNLNLIGFVDRNPIIDEKYGYPVLPVKKALNLRPEYVLFIKGDSPFTKADLEKMFTGSEVVTVSDKVKLSVLRNGLDTYISLDENRRYFGRSLPNV
ncbi:MAG: radical SAM protein [Oligoflexales bacterium]|nr:radical SAM protein [Oligoflexales bacterium]